MKRLLVLLGLLSLSGVIYAADPGMARPDLYGTPPSQWNYSLVTSTAAVNTAPGLLGKVTINATCTSPVGIWDSTTTAPATLPVVIATVTATAGLAYDYTGLRTTNGLTLIVGAQCTSGATVTYR